MKFPASLLLSAATTIVATQDAAAPANKDNSTPALRRTLLEDDQVCFTNGVLNVDDGCHFDPLLEALQERLDGVARCDGRDALTELSLMLDVPPEDVEEEINEMCREAIEDETDADGMTFVEIVDHSDVFVKAFFDGDTDWNTGRQTRNVDNQLVYRLQRDVGSIVKPIFNQKARTTFFEFPDNISNFDECELNGVMCCWVQDRQANDNNGNCATPYDRNCNDADPADNTDICYVDMSRAPESARVANGYSFFPGDDGDGEGAAHCHGFAWGDDEFDPSVLFKGNSLFFVSMYDHLVQRGYVRNVPGAPMCSCLEQAPVVSRSDCTQIDVTRIRGQWRFSATEGLSLSLPNIRIEFNSCEGVNADNDLYEYYRALIQDGRLTSVDIDDVEAHLVGNGNCDDAIQDFIASEF